MKSELRTELKSNLLADRLEEIVLAIKPHLKLIGFVLAALLAAVIIYAVVRARNEKAAAEAWSELYFSANQTEKLEGVYADYPQTSAGTWAKQKNADALLSQALVQVYVDRDMCDKLLKEAQNGYRSVLDKAQEPMLIARASFGLAQVLDSQGNSAEAAREFKKLLTLPGAHPEMIADAQRHLEFIESNEGRGFYEWFKTNRPTAPKPVDIPSDLGKLPNQPDMQFSTPLAPSVPSNTESTPGTLAPGTLAPGTLAPGLELPLAEKSSITEPPAVKTESGTATTPPALDQPIVEPTTKPSEPVIETPKVDVPKTDAKELAPESPEPAAPAKQDGDS